MSALERIADIRSGRKEGLLRAANGQKRPLRSTQSKAKSCDIMRNTPTARNHKETQVTNKEIIQGLYQNFASGDVPAVVATFDDNISWTEADGFPLALAGIWSTWKDPDTGLLTRTCAIITTESRGVVTPVHTRMPFALDQSAWASWLDRTLTDGAEVEALMIPLDADILMEHEVSKTVNSVRNNGASLTDPAGGTLDP